MATLSDFKVKKGLQVTGGDINLGNGQNAVIQVDAVSGSNVTGKSLSISSGESTGTGTSTINLATAPAGNTGSDVNSVTNKVVIGGAGVTTLTAGGNLDIGAHNLRAATLTADTMTAGGVAFYGTAGIPAYDSDITFSSDTLTVTKIGAFEATGAINFGSQDMTSVDINSGTIDGATIATSDVTVGSGKTLDVSAGTLTLANNQISGDVVEGGTIAATTISALTTAGITSTADIDIGSHDLKAETLTSDLADGGAAPLVVTSTTNVANLNASSLSGATFAAPGAIGGGTASSGTFTTIAGTTITGSGVLSIDDATESTSTTTGSVHTDGGLGVAKDAHFGNDLSLISDSALLTMGANDDVIIRHIPDEGIQIMPYPTTVAGNTALEIKSSADDEDSSKLRFTKDRGTDTADNDAIGKILFYSDDDGGNMTHYGSIRSMVTDASHADEVGAIQIRPTVPTAAGATGLIDGLTVAGRTNVNDGIVVSIGGNHFGNTYTTEYGQNSAGASSISLFQWEATDGDRHGQNYTHAGGGSQSLATVVPAINIGGGITPHTFAATGQGASAGDYISNLYINGSGYAEARIASVAATTDGAPHMGLGAAMVIETVDNESFNGYYMTRDKTNNTGYAWSNVNAGAESITDRTWAMGFATGDSGSLRFGHYADGYDDCVVSSNNPLSGTTTKIMDLQTTGDMVLHKSQAKLRLHGTSTYNTSLRASGSISANTIYTLPAADGSDGHVLTTDGSGIMSWSAESSGGTADSVLADDIAAGNAQVDIETTDAHTINIGASTAGATDTSAINIATGGTRTLTLGKADTTLDINSATTAHEAASSHTLTSPVSAITSTTSHTITSPATAITATTSVTATTPIFTVTSSTSASPAFTIENTANDGLGPVLKLSKNGASVADEDIVGTIDFASEDDGSNAHTYAKIYGEIEDASAGAEQGKLVLQVAELNGDLSSGLILTGGTANGVVDVTIGSGITSTTTVAGNLTVQGATTTVSSTTLEVTDDIITVSKGNDTVANADGSGVEIDVTGGTDLYWKYVHGNTAWTSNVDIDTATTSDVYKIAGTSVLTNNTLGSGVLTSSLTTVGALDAGSITSNFTSIDVGAGAISTTGLISGGSLDIDNVLINGTTIGHTNDTDLLTVASGSLTLAGTLNQEGVTLMDSYAVTLTTTSATTLFTIPYATYSAAKVIVSVWLDDGSDNRSVCEYLLTYAGASAPSATANIHLTEYAMLETGGAALATFDAVKSGANILFQITPGSATSTKVRAQITQFVI